MALLDADRTEQMGQTEGPSENARFIINKLLLWLILVPLFLVLIFLLLGGLAHGQEASTQPSCLIVKHKGVVGRRLIYFALIGVPIAPGANYDYIDSRNLSSPKMSYKGKQLEQIQSSGTHVIVLDKFTESGVAAAMQSCIASVPNASVPRTEPAAKQTAATPEGAEHPIEGYTLSGPGAGSADGDQASLGDAARLAKAKKQQTPAPTR